MSGTNEGNLGGKRGRFFPEHYKGLMDYRADTRFSLEEHQDNYLIFTSLHGLDAETLRVRVTPQHVILEGMIERAGVATHHRARYVHHIGELDIDISDYEVFYSDDNRVMVRLKRQSKAIL